MPLVAGIDSSTQSCKIVVRDADTGALVRQGRASHPDGTQIDPEQWWAALQEAAESAGGLADVAAISVGGQQHGMVCLDVSGEVVRPALLWNDTRSATQAEELIAEHGGPGSWADAVGSVPVASFTVTKLAWLAANEPEKAARTVAVCLPHDWLTWRLAGYGPGNADFSALRTDRGDASGTGYYSPATGEYRRDLLIAALGHDAVLPVVLDASASAGVTNCELSRGAVLGPGSGDNAAAALGLGAVTGDVVVSIGTSGVVSGISAVPANDPTGAVAGFADATGNYLPLICTLNAARVLDAMCRVLDVDHEGLSELALAADPGAGGVTLIPYFEGERTPNLPDATASISGLTLANATRANFARAAVEGLLSGLAAGLACLIEQGVDVHRVLLIGGGARSEAVRLIAPAVLGYPVSVPAASEYVADGASRQAAWVLSGSTSAPDWTAAGEPAAAIGV